MLDSLAGALGIKKAVLIPAAIGAGLAVMMGPRRTWPERLTTFLVGFFVSVYGTSPLVTLLGGAPGEYLGGVGFVLGLFGMATADAAWRMIRDTDLAGIIKGRFGK